MRYNKIALVIGIFLFDSLIAQAQDPTKWNEAIHKFEVKDSTAKPEDGLILFTGSSSIAMWQDVAEYFPTHKVLNRGFGGSQFSDLIYFANKVIYPYKPSKVFIYEGDNDIAAGEAPEQIIREAKELRKMIKENLPGVPVVFISIKPSIARWKFKDQYLLVNAGLKKYAKKKKLTMFADVWSPMIDANGQVYNVFLGDNLHMKPEGYKIWQSVLLPYLDQKKKD